MAAVEVLDRDEAARLLRAPSRRAPTGIRNRALMTVMYRGGLRCAEALDLLPHNVSLNEGTVRVLDGKGGKARTVALDDGSLAVVQLWIQTRAKFVRRPSCPLFCTLAGSTLDAGYVRAMVKRMGKRAGIAKRVHPHGLRHTNAAEMHAEGIPIGVIRDHLGHNSLGTTDIYLRSIAPADVIAAGRSRPLLNLEV